jgi:hypothetical protein
MKTELKTLKDLERIKDNNSNHNYVETKELRAEAIKWVKEYKDKEVLQDVREWIKHFFNIAEEELEK